MGEIFWRVARFARGSQRHEPRKQCGNCAISLSAAQFFKLSPRDDAAPVAEILHVIHPIDTGVPRRAWKRVLKEWVLRPLFPGVARRLFRVAGVSGFVAQKRAVARPA